MKKRVCIIMSAVGLLAIAQTAGAKVHRNILAEPNWVSTTNSQAVVATDNSQSMLAIPTSSNSPVTFTSPDGFTSTESHHGGGGGSGMEGKNMVDLGVGFGGGLSTYAVSGTGYSTSGGIGYMGKFEHMLTGNIGIGLAITYASTSETSTGTDYSQTTGAPFTYTEGWKFSALGFIVRGAYHFTVNDNFDPYVGIGLGYYSFTATYTNTDPNNANNPYYVAPTVTGLGGFAYSVFVGAHYYFASSIGAFLELGFSGYAGNLVNVGLALKF